MPSIPPEIRAWLRTLVWQSEDRDSALEVLRRIAEPYLDEVHPHDNRGTEPRDVFDDTVAVLMPRWEAVSPFAGLVRFKRRFKQGDFEGEIYLDNLQPGDKFHTEEDCWMTVTPEMLKAVKQWLDLDFKDDVVMKVLDIIVERNEKEATAPRSTSKSLDAPHERRLTEHVREAAYKYLIAVEAPLPGWLMNRSWRRDPARADEFFQELEVAEKREHVKADRAYQQFKFKALLPPSDPPSRPLVVTDSSHEELYGYPLGVCLCCGKDAAKPNIIRD